MDKQIKNIIDTYFKENKLELVDLTLKEHLDNVINKILEIKDIEMEYEDIETDKNILPSSVNKIFYKEYNNYLKPYLDKIKNQIDVLDNIPKVEQRSKEWHEFRNELISASSIHKVLIDKSDRQNLIFEKIGIYMPFLTCEPITHGIIFEIVSQCIYESRNNVKIHEYGCIPHPEHNFIGASPDGVVYEVLGEDDINGLSLYGRLLEIKNPYSRQITDKIKPDYYSQVVAQQEVCKLPICDFLETNYYFYDNMDDFFKCNIIMKDYNIENIPNIYLPICNFSSNFKEKGILLKFRKENSYESELFPLHVPYIKENIEAWIDSNVEEYKKKDFEFERTIYWELKEYSCKTVKFDNNHWSKLYEKSKEVWDKIINLRLLTDEDVLKQFIKLEKKDNTISKVDIPSDNKYKLRNLKKKEKKKEKLNFVF
jgi:putative phage-type endonuclease